MDEEQWLACADPAQLLRFLSGREGLGRQLFSGRHARLPRRLLDRKCRLFACAACRAVEQRFGPKFLRFVAVSERYADGLATRAELKAARDEAHWVANPPGIVPDWDDPWPGENALISVTASDAVAAALCISTTAADFPYYFSGGRVDTAVGVAGILCGGLREVFGNSFRPLALAPSLLTWQGGLIPRLAEAAYEERPLPDGALDAERLTVLADAVEESGLAGVDLAGHLRSAGPHVQGCHALDLILGKP